MLTADTTGVICGGGSADGIRWCCTRIARRHTCIVDALHFTITQRGACRAVIFAKARDALVLVFFASLLLRLEIEVIVVVLSDFDADFSFAGSAVVTLVRFLVSVGSEAPDQQLAWS